MINPTYFTAADLTEAIAIAHNLRAAVLGAFGPICGASLIAMLDECIVDCKRKLEQSI